MQKQVAFLTLIFVILAAGVYWGLQQSPETSKPLPARKPLISIGNLKMSAMENAQGAQDQISRIEIIKHEGTLLNASFEQGRWSTYHIDGVTGFPLLQSSLSALVRTLLDAQVVEYKSALSKNHARLGLLSPSDPQSTASLVRLYTKSGTIELLIGNKATVQTGQFVRFAKQDQMLLIDKTLTLPDTGFDWLVKTMLPLSIDDVFTIERESVLGWFIDKSDALNRQPTSKPTSKPKQLQFQGEQFTLRNLKQDQHLAYPLTIANYVTSLVELEFEQVFEFDQEIWDASEKLMRLKLITLDKEKHSLEIAKQNGQYLVKITSAGKLNKLNNWLFSIAENDANALLKTKADFLNKNKN